MIRKFKKFEYSKYNSIDDIDEILDKISSDGIGSLNPMEHVILQNFSKDDEFIDGLIDTLVELIVEQQNLSIKMSVMVHSDSEVLIEKSKERLDFLMENIQGTIAALTLGLKVNPEELEKIISEKIRSKNGK